jgi:tetratricopeptide (TPR) repeat protein/predicted Zn-ribbon and HTH transcriptional regulator
MAIAEGDTLDGRYKVLGVHPGGMGVVYILEDRDTGEIHAAKTVKPELRDDLRVRRRFEGEVRTWIRLGRHENLVEAKFVRDLAGLPFLFLEFIEGPTLAEVLAADAPFNLSQAVDFAIQAARGLTHAQETPLGSDGRGIVHRDVKPENLFVTRDRTVKVSDLGIAKVLSADLESTAEGIGMGTPFYVPPEQLKGSQTIDGRADIYSLGAVIYQMITGEIPLRSESLESQIYRILREVPEPASASNPAVPKVLDRIIARCLEKKPSDRYPSFRVLGKELRALLNGGALLDADPPQATCKTCGYASSHTPTACPVCEGSMGAPMKFEGRADEEERAADPSLTPLVISATEATPRTVRMGEPLTVTIRVVNRRGVPVRPAEMTLPLPDMDVFRLERAAEVWRGEIPPSPPGRPFRISYALVPLREGTFDLPAPVLRYDEHLESVARGPSVRFHVNFNYRLPLVGRDEERRALLEFSRRGRAGFALVFGEAGSGRSRILREIGEELSDGGHLVLEGKALSGVREPLKVFHDVARQIFGAGAEPLSGSSAMARVIDRLAPLVGRNPEMAGFFAAFLRRTGIPESQVPMRGYLWFRLLSAMAREKPVVLVLSDLHWADEESIDLAAGLVQRAADEGVLLTVLTSSLRADSDPGTQRRIDRLQLRFSGLAATPESTLRVSLERLRMKDVARLLESVFPGNTLGEDHPWLLPALTTQSGGNPFHVVQILKQLREARDDVGEPLVSAEGGTWMLRPELTEDRISEWIPEAVEDMVRAMVTPLPAPVRDLLERAAVIGEEFEVSILKELVEDPAAVDEGLDALEHAEFIRMRGERGERYTFTSSQVPQIVERLIRERSRRLHQKLHREVASALKATLSRTDLRKSAHRYARHLNLAGERERALRWLVISAEAAVKGQLFLRADAFLNRAADLVDDGVEASRRILGNLYFLRGEVLRMAGQLTEALVAFERATDYLGGSRGREILTRSLSRTGRIHEVRGELDRALYCFQVAAQLNEEAGDVAGLALSLGDLGAIQLQRGEEEKAYASYERSRELAEESSDPRALAETLDHLAALEVRRGEWGRSESNYRDSLEIWERIGDRLGTAQALNGLGNVALRQGRLEDAREMYQRAIELRREVGDREGTANLLSNLGVIHDRLGRFEESLTYYRRSAEAHRAIGSRRGLALVLNNIGVVNLSRGDVSMAVGRFEEALAIRRSIGDRDRVGRVLVNLGEAYTEAGRLDQAQATLDEALEILKGAEDRIELVEVFCTRAELMRRRGNLDGALSELERGFLEENPDPLVRSGLHLGMGEILLDRGALPEALASSDRALLLARESGDRMTLARAHRVRGQALYRQGRLEEGLRSLSEAEELLLDTSGPELARVYLSRGEALKESDPARSREVFMRAKGLLDALTSRGAALPEAPRLDGLVS